MMERFLLAKERTQKIKNENVLKPEFQEYFRKISEWIELVCDTWEFVAAGGLCCASMEELAERLLGKEMMYFIEENSKNKEQ